MATMASRKTISIHDYPEHLNPFHEEDNHNKIRFWTIGRRLSRSNSITFTGIKDLKNSWAFRSFLRKGKKGQQTSQEKKPNTQVNGDASPIVYRRAMQYSTSSTTPARNTVGSPDRYVYGGSITPLPRSRFQERLRSISNHEVNSLSLTPRMARSEVSGSRLSVESTNPFEEDPVPPVRASRRKKKRAPLPPPATADVSINSESSELQITKGETESKATGDLEIEDVNLNVELKIIEDEDVKSESEAKSSDTIVVTNKESERETEDTKNPTSPCKDKVDITSISSQDENVEKKEPENDNNGNINETLHITEDNVKNADSEEDILNKVSFSKVDITKYRRNSSVNEDDIRLRRGNLEDFHSLSNKRSKSLNNDLDTTYMTYDINLNENIVDKDANDNDEPQRVICKLYDEPTRKQSIDTISSTEKEFIEIDKATREFEIEINKLTSALNEDEFTTGARLSVSDIKRRFDIDDVSSPNPIPKPRRSHYGSNSPVNGNCQ